MIPAFVFRYLMRNDNLQPLRLEVRLEPETPLVIVAAIGMILPAAYLNSLMVSFIDFGDLFESEPLDTPVKILMAFISIAIVPALCEEFLFRGCILSNLLPYGKTTAILASAVLFSMMHGNIAQFFYTFVAGLVLGAVYVETGSIWPCTFIHLFNNFYSVIQQVIYERAGETEQINIVIFIMEVMIPAAGLALGAWLIYLRVKNGKRTEGALPTKVCEIENIKYFKGFLNPVMIAHFVITLLLAGTTVLMALGS
jgi:membrane protease YdiL (CAAX protease family)